MPGEVTELSAANSLFIDFSKLRLGRARGSRWPCAVYTACEECSCSTMIFAFFFKLSLRWGQQAAAEGEHCAKASSVTPGVAFGPVCLPSPAGLEVFVFPEAKG